MKRGLFLGIVMALVAVASAAAQSDGRRIEGRVVDAGDASALGGAEVTLEPVAMGTLQVPGTRHLHASILRTHTAADGRYGFDGLPLGRYVLRVDRIGYRSARVEIVLGPSVSPRLTLGLQVEPIALEPLIVRSAPGAVGRVDPREPELTAGLETIQAVERARHLEPDAQIVSGHDVTTAGSFPEPDLMRAIQRLPGMSTRDTYSGELRTRGSSWGQTRVYLDDLPLFDPLIAAGSLSGLGPGVVGTVFVHSGPRPVSVGEGAAGVVRIGTRAAQEPDGLPLLAELGLGTAQATTERRFLGGRAGLLISGRRSWYDRIWNGLATDRYDPEGPFDFVARSSVVRLDAQFGEASGITYGRYRGNDDLAGNAAMLLTGSTGDWGSATDQLTLSTPIFGRAGRIVLGSSVYDARVDPSAAAFVPPVDPSVVVLRPGATRIEYRKAALEIAPRTRIGIGGGIDVVDQSLRASGASEAVSRSGGTTGAGRQRGLAFASPWVSYRTVVRPGIDVEGGVRVDLGGYAGGQQFATNPHLAVRSEPLRDLFVTAAARRSRQYLQAIGPAGTRFGTGHSYGQAWILAGPSTPAIRADLISIGLERRLAAGWWLAARGWGRRATGVAVAPVSPGRYPEAPVPWVEADQRAGGFELQLRGLSGPVTGRLSYGWLTATDRVGSARVPSVAERPHSLDALVGIQLTPSLQVGGSLEVFSGVPYARRIADPCLDALGRTDSCVVEPTWVQGSVGHGRSPGYMSFDLRIDWSRRHETWGWGLSGQLRNVLGRDNFGAYRGTDCPASLSQFECAVSPLGSDRFYRLPGFPLPMLAFRAWF